MNNEINKKNQNKNKEKVYNDINGYFVLDKPKNCTSNDALCIIKKYLHPRKK